MRVSIELPDPPRLEPLLETLSQQYREVMDQLLKLQQEDRTTPVLRAVSQQTDSLVQAFQTMLSMMAQGRQADHQQMQKVIHEQVATPQQQANDALLTAIRGLKRSVTGLPDNLGSVMDKSFRSRQSELMKSAPKPKAAPDGSNRIVAKLDEMEQALVRATKKSRSRTFGSNY